jgi:hypothetical protein
MQAKSKSTILFTVIICLFCFQLFPEPAAAMDNMSDQRRIEAETVRTLEPRPAEPKADAVLAIPGLVLKLGPGFGCAEKVHKFSYPIPQHGGYCLYRRDIATHPTFKINEICFGNPKGPDIKRDFKWFMISGEPVNSPQAGCQLPPGLVLSLYPLESQGSFGVSKPTKIFYSSDVARYPKSAVIINNHDDQLGWLETTGRCSVEWSLIEKLPKFTIVGLKNHRTQKTKSFKWQEKVYDCADSEQTAPPGFRRAFSRDYCWFEKTIGPTILPEP